MAYSKIDDLFISAFQENYIEHLKADPIPGGENQARDMVADAISGDNTGKLTRLFDALTLPTISNEQLLQNLKEAQNIENLMRPTLNAAAKILLTEDKSRLHDHVIEAIGLNQYAQLAHGVVQNGQVVAVQGKEQEFQDREALIAHRVLSSTLVNYSMRLLKYQLTPEEEACRNDLQIIFDRIRSIKKEIKTGDTKIIIKDLHALQSSIQEVTTLLNNKSSNEDLSPEELSHINDIYEAGNNFINQTLQTFMNHIIQPLQQMATSFTMDQLEQSANKTSLIDLENKVSQFLAMTQRAQQDLSKQVMLYRQENKLEDNAPLPEAMQDAIEAINSLNERLSNVANYPSVMKEEMGISSPDTIAQKMKTEYEIAVKFFVSKVTQEVMPAKPPESIMSIILKCLRALVTGKPSTIGHEIREYKQSQKEKDLREELNILRNNFVNAPSENDEAPRNENPPTHQT